ncbi:Crp/Fnr family transcriptional regulator [Devosia sediminis]|uniref:Crp/Fnr family transcriptional regulator n=1 Tax=Devosia sediminis TaxID=2798801 RepID=UPI002E2A6566|nr:Crp/Fnr family transcriptional regulator [Devosia sediminis]
MLSAPPGTDPVERFLHRLAKFEPLEAEARDALRRAIVRGPLVPPYQEVHGESVPDVVVLLSGWACHFQMLGNGKRQISTLVVPGDFADFGFLTGSAADIQYVTTAPSQFGRIRARQFSELTEQFPSIMRATLKAAAMETAIGRERLISLGLRTAIERLAHLICELWWRLSVAGLVGPDNSFHLPMTQAELGAALGLSTVHVNRTLQALRRRDIIGLQGGKVHIHDLKYLTTLSSFDAGYLTGAAPSRAT